MSTPSTPSPTHAHRAVRHRTRSMLAILAELDTAHQADALAVAADVLPRPARTARRRRTVRSTPPWRRIKRRAIPPRRIQRALRAVAAP